MKSWWLLPLALATTSAAAQPRPAGPDSLTRRAMALAYLRIELAVRDRPLAADRATLAFFGGRYQQVIGTLDSLGTVIEADPAGERHVISSSDGEVPYRLYRPQSLGSRPAPVIVALHGAGADETAFQAPAPRSTPSCPRPGSRSPSIRPRRLAGTWSTANS